MATAGAMSKMLVFSTTVQAGNLHAMLLGPYCVFCARQMDA